MPNGIGWCLTGHLRVAFSFAMDDKAIALEKQRIRIALLEMNVNVLVNDLAALFVAKSEPSKPEVAPDAPIPFKTP